MSDLTKFKGGAALQQLLDQLPAKLEQNVMRAALRQGMNVIKTEAQANAPEESGVLREGMKVSTRAKGGVVRATLKTGGKHGYLAPWFEYGTKPHRIAGKKGSVLAFAAGTYRAVEHPGMRPRPFMRPALDTKTAEAIQAVAATIKKRLTKQGLDASGVDTEADSE